MDATTNINRSKHVLVIDDDPRHIASVAGMLEDEGFIIQSATNGHIARSLLQIEAPPLILLDLNMPDVDGFQVLQYLNAHFRDSAVIILSGTDSTEDAAKAIREGAFDFLTKPCNKDKLLNTLEHALEFFQLRKENREAKDFLADAHARFTKVMNSMEAVVYVAAMDNHELLYMNQYGLKRWPSAKSGTPCWATIQEGQEGPCSFCTNDKLLDGDGQPTGVYLWEFQNASTGEWFDCRDQAIRWPDGRMVRLEVAIDITSRKRLEQSANRREKYLRGLSALAELFLRQPPEIPYQAFTDIMGRAAGVSRVYFFSTYRDSTEALLINQVAEWCKPGISPQLDNPLLHNQLFSGIAPRWEKLLSAGQPVRGRVKDFPQSERAILEAQDIESVLAYPILMDGVLKGFAGFDDCESSRDWQADEEEFLAAAVGYMTQCMSNWESKQQLDSRMRAEHLLADLSARFIDLHWENLATGIEWMLALIGEFVDADRSYVFELSPDGKTMINSFEWCAPGIPPLRPEHKCFEFTTYNWSMSRLVEGKSIRIFNVAELPQEVEERAAMLDTGIKSRINVPMLSRGHGIGFVGFDTTRAPRAWTDSDQRVLSVAAQILVSAQQRTAAERAQGESEQKLRALLQSAGEGILGIDLAGNCSMANKSALASLGYAHESELVGRPLHSLIHHSHPDGSAYPLQECKACLPSQNRAPVSSDDEVFWRRDGSHFPVEYQSQPIFQDGAIAGIVINFSDISNRLETQRRLIFLAEHDPLTGLPNRAMFMDRLSSGIARARREHKKLALLFLDLDRFKPVNDTHGHLVGDKLLCHIAQRLMQIMREVDTVARIGGDEFGLVLEGISQYQDAVQVGLKVQQELDAPFRIGGIQVRVGASLGIALYPDDGESPDQLISASDAEMYLVKKRWRRG